MTDLKTLRLPLFVNGDSINKKLGWAPSIKRAFREAAVKASLRDWPSDNASNVYHDIATLISRPAGMRQFEALVVQADPSKKRGLLAAVHRAFPPQSNSTGALGELTDELRESLEAGQTHDAAWITFHRLAFAEPVTSVFAEPDLKKMILLIEADPALQMMLGDYWVDWRAMAYTGSPAVQSAIPDFDAAPVPPEPTEPPVAPTPSAPSPQTAAPEASELPVTWARELDGLTALMSGAPLFDVDLPVRLENAAGVLRRLIQQHSEQTLIEREARRSEARNRFSSSLGALRDEWESPITLPQALTDAGAAATEIELLDEADAWAVGARSAAKASHERCRAANLRREKEDTDAADDEVALASRERRALRVQIESDAALWASKLSGMSDGGGIGVADTDASTTDSKVAAIVEDRRDPVTPVADARTVTNPPDRTGPSDVLAFEQAETTDKPTDKDVDVGDNDADVVIAGLEGEPPAVSGGALKDGAAEAAKHAAPEDAPADPPQADSGPTRETGATSQDDGANAPGIEELAVFLPEPAAALSAEAETLEALTRRALQERRYGFAVHLSQAARSLGAPGLAGDGPVLEALAVGVSVSERRVAQAASAYTRLEGGLYAVNDPGSFSRSTRLLLMAGALRPAIFSSQTSAAEVFRLAEPGGFGSALHDLSEFLADMPRRGGHLDFSDVAPAADEQSRRRFAETARDELLRAVDNAGDRRAVFQRAMSILIGVLNAGDVGDAIASIRRAAANAPDKAEAAADWLDGDLDRRIEQLDDEARRPRRGSALEGMARRWLAQRLGEIASLLRQWASAEKSLKGSRSGHVGEMRAQLRQLMGAAAEAVRSIDAEGDTAFSRDILSRVIDEIVALLDGEATDVSVLDLEMLLHDDLLLVNPYPDLGPDRLWTASAALDLFEGASAVFDEVADFEGAFRRLVKRGRFVEAESAIERIAADGGERASLDDQVREERKRRRETLEQDAAILRRKLDDVLGADTAGRVDLSLQVRVDALAQILAGEPDLIDFPAVQSELRSLEEEVGDIGELLLAPLRAEIDALELSDAVAATLRRMADKGDLTTLREHVEAVKTGADLGTSAGERLRSFAKQFLTPAFEKLGAPSRNTTTLIDLATARKANESVDFSLLKDEDVAGSTELLKAWRAVKGAKANTQAFAPAMRDLFTALRFTSVRITGPHALPPAQRFGLVCDRIGDRRDCPVPAFGSAAKGNYAVIVIDTVSVKNGVELFNLVKRLESPTTKPTIIVVVGAPLPTSRRREYMVEARKRGVLEPCALIDEAAILFLASRPGRGLSDLFTISLPMGAVQPYSDANGQTSPEMFFGRDAELTQLWDRYGSCLVYGGRQLGKTALLEQLRLRHHRPPAQVVIGGSIQGITDIWDWLLKNLRDAEVPVKGIHANAICDSIRDWLSKDDTRRLLILVDEADIYLQAQMSGDYASLIKVRELMQDTERRCKFVFAGLHNVQRLARQPNSPLLHFGTPLRVGPLYGADLGEARAMIERPMAAAGFVYSADTLPGRVLSELGYYPSLLQTFGKTLIDRLNRSASARMPQSGSLPIVISESDINDVLTDDQFRNNLSEKFEATLSLDERYRLITYAMLVHSMDRRGLNPALQDVEVQARALDWWPQGFAQDSTLDAFQGLLQEMVGLGVLIEADGRYAIRSSRIAAMLGGRREIERKLLEMSVMPGYQKLDTGSFRRLDKDSLAPSPMTARQEGVTLATRDAPSVQLVLGSKALGLDDLSASLEVLADEELNVERGSYENLAQMLAKLEVRRPRRTLLVLTGPWPGREGVAELLRSEQVRKSRRGGRRALQVMLAPLTVEWRDLADIDHTGRLWGLDLVTLAPLGDTGLRQWLRAVAQSETAEAIAELRELTGGFPLMLHGLAGKNPAELIERAREVTARRMGDPETLAALGLADPVLRRTADLIALLGGHSGKATEELLADEGVSEPRVATAHLERLGILEIGTQPLEDRVLNPFVAKLLAALGE